MTFKISSTEQNFLDKTAYDADENKNEDENEIIDRDDENQYNQITSVKRNGSKLVSEGIMETILVSIASD